MFELRFTIRIIRATSVWAKQPEIGKIASFSDGRVICQFVICVEALRKEQRGGYCHVQNLLEQVEVEQEYNKQLWNHGKGQHVSAHDVQVKPSCQHGTGAPIYAAAYTYFYFRLWWAKAG